MPPDQKVIRDLLVPSDCRIAPEISSRGPARLAYGAGDKQLGASPRPATAAHRRQPHSQPQSWTDRQAAKGAPPARRSAKVLNRARGKALSAPFAHHQLRRTRYTVGSPNRASAHSTAYSLFGNVRVLMAQSSAVMTSFPSIISNVVDPFVSSSQ
jgi:hypothetical protein